MSKFRATASFVGLDSATFLVPWRFADFPDSTLPGRASSLAVEGDGRLRALVRIDRTGRLGDRAGSS